jgi:hypothetical protein
MTHKSGSPVKIRIPRTKEALNALVDEVLARPCMEGKAFWSRTTFQDILILLRSTNPKLTSKQREKLHTKLCIDMLEKLSNKIIADRKFEGVQAWDLVSKMYMELSKYNLEKGTSSYSYFYTVGIREAYSLTTLASRQIVPIFLNYKEEYPLSRYQKDPSIIEKDGYLVIYTTKTSKGKVRVWYQPINGVLDIHSLYSMDFEEDESFIIPEDDPFVEVDTDHHHHLHITEDIDPAVDIAPLSRSRDLSYNSDYDSIIGESIEDRLNLVREAIAKVANNKEIAIKSYAFFYWLNLQPNTAKTEHQVWEAFTSETKTPVHKNERPLIIHVLNQAIRSL